MSQVNYLALVFATLTQPRCYNRLLPWKRDWFSVAKQ